jgi:hypothetical protein
MLSDNIDRVPFLLLIAPIDSNIRREFFSGAKIFERKKIIIIKDNADKERKENVACPNGDYFSFGFPYGLFGQLRAEGRVTDK